MLNKRVYEVDPLCCPEFGGQMQVVSFIEPRQADVIEKILKDCGLWQSRSPRAPTELDELVLQLDAAWSSSSIDSPDQADQSQELTYVEIDTFLESFQSSATRIGMGTMRGSWERAPELSTVSSSLQRRPR